MYIPILPPVFQLHEKFEVCRFRIVVGTQYKKIEAGTRNMCHVEQAHHKYKKVQTLHKYTLKLVYFFQPCTAPHSAYLSTT